MSTLPATPGPHAPVTSGDAYATVRRVEPPLIKAELSRIEIN
jgi:hypothetical protein